MAHGEGEIRVGLTHGLVGASVAGCESIVVNDTSVDERFLGRVDQESGYITHSVLVIPLRTADGTVIGAFQALNKPEASRIPMSRSLDWRLRTLPQL